MGKNIFLSIGAALLALCAFSPLSRAALTINNPSFETQTVSDGGSVNGTSSSPDTTTITSWTANTIGGTGGGYGLINPISNNSVINNSTVDGNNVAYINTANPGTISAEIYQNIGTFDQAGSYTLTLLVGDRKDLLTGTPIITLLQGSSFSSATAITGTSGSNPALVNDAGNMVQWSFTYNITDTTSATWIELSAGGVNGWVAFDNVQIQAVPEPVNVALALFGIVAIGGIAGRRWLASKKMLCSRNQCVYKQKKGGRLS